MFCSVPGDGIYFSSCGPHGAWLSVPPTRSSPVLPEGWLSPADGPWGSMVSAERRDSGGDRLRWPICFTLLWKWELEGETGRHSRGPGTVPAEVSTFL